MLCSAKGAGCWGGLCMDNIGSERVKLSPSNNDNWPAYNRCIGTVAESPKQGMRTDDTRSWNQLRCDPHTWVTMAEFTTCLAENGIRPLSITERDRRGIRTLNAKLRTTDGRPCLALEQSACSLLGGWTSFEVGLTSVGNLINALNLGLGNKRSPQCGNKIEQGSLLIMYQA